MNMTLNKALFSSKRFDYITPKWLYEKLNAEFHFDLDPCTSEDNPLDTKYFFTEKDDGLKKDWCFANSVFINPPYGRDVGDWAKKASISAKSNPDQTIVMLIAGRTDTKWFHDFIYDVNKDQFRPNVKVRFLKGRVRFELKSEGIKPNPAFPSIIVIFQKEKEVVGIG